VGAGGRGPGRPPTDGAGGRAAVGAGMEGAGMPEGAGATFMVFLPGGGIGAGGSVTGAVGDLADAGGSGAEGMLI
jgi:hypothetical protein